MPHHAVSDVAASGVRHDGPHVRALRSAVLDCRARGRPAGQREQCDGGGSRTKPQRQVRMHGRGAGVKQRCLRGVYYESAVQQAPGSAACQEAPYKVRATLILTHPDTAVYAQTARAPTGSSLKTGSRRTRRPATHAARRLRPHSLRRMKLPRRLRRRPTLRRQASASLRSRRSLAQRCASRRVATPAWPSWEAAALRVALLAATQSIAARGVGSRSSALEAAAATRAPQRATAAAAKT